MKMNEEFNVCGLYKKKPSVFSVYFVVKEEHETQSS
jgi:hypothetical protein